jgi:ABC-2 type transport system permease protein
VNDIGTVIWKEWKELVGRSSQSRSDTVKTVVVAAVILGIFVWRAQWIVSNLGAFIIPSFALIQLLAGIVADSIAGERERHTLETLLASRLSDLSILIGKMLAGVFLAWGLMVFVMGLGVLTAYLRQEGNQVQVPLGHLSALLFIYLLICLVVSSAAVLVSLRASTVRQAIQTLTWSFMIVFFVGLFAVVRLPPEWRAALIRALAGDHLLRTELIVMASLGALASLLFAAARLRFQRARLILD